MCISGQPPSLCSDLMMNLKNFNAVQVTLYENRESPAGEAIPIFCYSESTVLDKRGQLLCIRSTDVSKYC